MSERRIALIIACAEYEDPKLYPLPRAAEDARQLERVLGNPDLGGFEVTVLLNEPHDVIGSAIEELAAGKKPDDLLLLYFSCHGIKDQNGQLYFAGRDTTLQRLRTTAISADLVNDLVNKESRSRKKVLVLDCNFGRAYPAGDMYRGSGRAQVVERFYEQSSFAGRGFVVMSASDGLQYSYEDDRVAPHSVFTRNFVRGIESGDADIDSDGQIGVLELYQYVEARVHEERPEQHPQFFTYGIQEDFPIARVPSSYLPQDGADREEHLSIPWELAEQGGFSVLEGVLDREGYPITLLIPQGSESGDSVRRERLGMPGRYGGKPGDLVVHLEVGAPPIEVTAPPREQPSPSPRLDVHTQERTKVFISYSHKNRKWLERLQVFLKPLERQGLLDRWDDTRIATGDRWRQEIEGALATAKVAVLLISADFMASDFIMEAELPSLLSAAQDQGLVVMPVILSPSWFEDTPELSQFQSVNPPSKPMIGMRVGEREAFWLKLSQDIAEIVSPRPSLSPP